MEALTGHRAPGDPLPVLVLTGYLGAGKTTLLRILMGLERPDAGRAAGAGRVAAVFQEDRLCPQLSAVENVLLVLPDGRARREAVEADFALLKASGTGDWEFDLGEIRTRAVTAPDGSAIDLDDGILVARKV